MAFSRCGYQPNLERLWGYIKDFDARDCRTSDEVFARAQQLFLSYNERPQYWAKLSDSMVTRLNMVIESEGCWTKY